MNLPAIKAIYTFEMARARRTLMQSIVSPVVSTSLYFVVFGAAIGSRISEIEGVSYGAFIVPGLIMLMLLTQSIANASFGIYFPRFAGTIFEILSAPISAFEIVIGYVGAAATKSIILGLIVLATAWLFVPIEIKHPFFMLFFLVLTAATFSLFGFILGLWADGFEKLQLVPLLDHHAPHLPRRHLLFDPCAAAVLAESDAVQSRRLSGQRLPLELFRHGRCQRGFEPQHDAALSRHLPLHCLVDLQDRISSEELIASYRRGSCREP